MRPSRDSLLDICGICERPSSSSRRADRVGGRPRAQIRHTRPAPSFPIKRQLQHQPPARLLESSQETRIKQESSRSRRALAAAAPHASVRTSATTMAQLGDNALLQASESANSLGAGECLDAAAGLRARCKRLHGVDQSRCERQFDVVDLLLAGAPVNTPACTHTALRAATLNGQAALVDKLLKAGADASIVSNNARTPLMGACYPRHGVPEASTAASSCC